MSAAIRKELQSLVDNNLEYFQGFDKVQIFYDRGQKPLDKIINDIFGEFGGYEQVANFDHSEKKLFQVADMLTYVDKIIYKYKHNIKLTTTEAIFFSIQHIKMTIREFTNHRFESK